MDRTGPDGGRLPRSPQGTQPGDEADVGKEVARGDPGDVLRWGLTHLPQVAREEQQQQRQESLAAIVTRPGRGDGRERQRCQFVGQLRVREHDGQR